MLIKNKWVSLRINLDRPMLAVSSEAFVLSLDSGPKPKVPSSQPLQQWCCFAVCYRYQMSSFKSKVTWELLMQVAKEHKKSISSLLVISTYQALLTLSTSIWLYSQFQRRGWTFVKARTLLRSITMEISLLCIGEGNSNPLQCSSLENPRDGGAWWAAVYGVSESDTTEAT